MWAFKLRLLAAAAPVRVPAWAGGSGNVAGAGTVAGAGARQWQLGVVVLATSG